VSYQIPLKYILPAFVALLVLLIAAWAFNLPPVSALTDRGSEPLELTVQPNGQITGFPYDVVQVSGQGTATGVPDLAQIQLTVSVTSDTVSEAWNNAAQTMEKVRESLTASGIEEKDVATQRIRISPNYEYGPDGRMQEGFVAENSLNVTVRDTESVGTVLDDAVTAGGDHIRLGSFDFQLSDTAALEQEARAAAVADMQAKAKQIAISSRRNLGDLKIVSEIPGIGLGEEMFGLALFAAEAASFDTPVSTGEKTITVNVYGVYELRR